MSGTICLQVSDRFVRPSFRVIDVKIQVYVTTSLVRTHSTGGTYGVTHPHTRTCHTYLLFSFPSLTPFRRISSSWTPPLNYPSSIYTPPPSYGSVPLVVHDSVFMHFLTPVESVYICPPVPTSFLDVDRTSVRPHHPTILYFEETNSSFCTPVRETFVCHDVCVVTTCPSQLIHFGPRSDEPQYLHREILRPLY